MKTELKNTKSSRFTQFILAFCCILFAAIGSLVGEIAFPLSISTMAALFLFDSTKQRRLSIIVSILLVLLNVFTFTLRIGSSFFAAATVILGYLIYIAFNNKQSKSDYAFLMTLIAGFIIAFGYVVLPMNLAGEYTGEVVVEFYTNLVTILRGEFVKLLFEAYSTAGLDVTTDMIAEIFNSQLNMIISYVLIMSFFIVGVSFKMFGFLVKKLAIDDTEINSFRFSTTNLFAYFYIILTLASVFVSSQNGILGISVLNLYNFFLFVYAYVGFNVALSLFIKKFKPVISVILLLVALVVMSSLGVQILAVLGVMFTIRKNTENRLMTK